MTTTTRTLTDLLARLAELLPLACIQNGTIFQLTCGGIDASLPMGWREKMILQWAIQQAIEAQGWLWMVRLAAPGVNQAVIHIKGAWHQENQRIGEAESTEGPAHALLDAFVQALEARAEVA